MTALVAAVLAAVWPGLPIHYQLAHRPLLHARGLWQWSLLFAAFVVTAEAGDWWLAAMAAWFLWRWHGEHADALYPVVGTWVGIGATWYLVRAIPPAGWTLVEECWIIVGGLLALATLIEWRLKARPQAWLGQRMALGGFTALLMAVGPLWTWVILAVPFWFAGPAWSAVLALAVAAAWRWPITLAAWPLIICALAAGIRWRPSYRLGWVERWTPRGDSLDSLRLRLVAWVIGCAWLRRYPETRWRGTYGHIEPESAGTMLRSYTLSLHAVPRMDSFHCEPLQHTVEFGVLGAVAVVAFAVRVGAGLTLGDPWSAAALAGAVLMGCTIAARIAPLGLLFLVICARVAP